MTNLTLSHSIQSSGIKKTILLETTYEAPLGTTWEAQPVRLWLHSLAVGQACELMIDGNLADFQFTGNHCEQRGSEVFVLLDFEAQQKRTLAWQRTESSSTNLSQLKMDLQQEAVIGPAAISLAIPAPIVTDQGRKVCGPFANIASFAQQSMIFCEQPFEKVTLTRTNTGPLFEDYELCYQFAQRRSYSLAFRFWKHETMVEVSERFSLGMNATLTWTLNPQRVFDSILSREFFEIENQPELHLLSEPRVRDVLCRLQMPTLSDYFVPNNRGWFALLNGKNYGQKMFGVMGLYGAKWAEPVANMPEIFAREGSVEWTASLASGSRHFLLHVGPVETNHTPQRRLVYHRLHAQFNACRLDEHMDLSGEKIFDQPIENGFFGGEDYHAQAAQRLKVFRALKEALEKPNDWMQQNGAMHTACFRYLIDASSENARALHDQLLARFEKWVRQFQGWRIGESDYMKNVIGFSRFLRGMLLGYEMLRRDDVLTQKQIARLNAYFVFAARRITDLGRWPHNRTTLHPDHPESSRDFYTYGGEHKPDRLYWTNCLPNFQSDPLCALAHLSAIFRDHPDARAWRKLALDDIDGQLDAYCGKSGAWQESINYALYTFSYFVITFRALKAHLGIDYFQDERVRRFAMWLVHFLGPIDKRWDKYTWPGVGNAVCPTGGGEFLLCFASQLSQDDPLRDELISAWQKLEPNTELAEHYPTVMAALAPMPATMHPNIPLRPLTSECMDEVGVALRDRHTLTLESYLFQKIGFAKDHYEADETSFNWYAKGTPLCMDYGTYTGDVGVGGAHNVVEIPDEDALRRGYLAAHHFTPLLDYTHCEVPVTLKLLWGRVRSFEEVENKDGKIDRTQTPYFYIGDKNPVGPKTWKIRKLLFVKPDYVAIFDRVFGDVPHRYNLHVTGSDLKLEGNLLMATGDFDLDLHALVQHPSPAGMDHEVGRLVPNFHLVDNPGEAEKHAQSYWRLHNRTDGVYRTLLFAKEKKRDVKLLPLGTHGMKVITPEYTDVVFLNDDVIEEDIANVSFAGRSGWIRRTSDGQIKAMLIDGDHIEAFGVRLSGRGPWMYNMDGKRAVELLAGPIREVDVEVINKQ